MQLFEICLKCFTAFAALVGVYNIFFLSRKVAQEQSQKAKIEQALQLGQENKQEIKTMKELAELRNTAVDQHLKQIRDDTSWMRDLLTKWLLDTSRKP